MLEYARWKYVVALLVLLLSVLYALPNLFPQDPSVQISSSRGAEADSALRQRVETELTAAALVPKAIELDEKGNLLVRTTDVEAQGKAADVLRAALGTDYVVALNLASTEPEWLARIGAKRMLLGLDLQGGVHFTMEVDKKAATDKRLDAYAEDVRALLRDKRINYTGVLRRPDNTFQVNLSNPADSQKAIDVIRTGLPRVSSGTGAGMMASTTPMVRLDTPSAGVVSIQPDARDLQQITSGAIEQNIGTLRNRINQLGVAEPIIQRQGAERVVVQLPGVQDTAQAKRILGATATLEYRAVVDGDAVAAAATGDVPPEARIYYTRERGAGGQPIPYLLNKRVIATGEQLVHAQSGYDARSGTPMVSVRLNEIGGQRMFDFTSQSVGKPMAVVYVERIPEVRMVDGKEVRSTRISEEIISVAAIQGVFGKEFQTTGLDSPKEAANLALLLRAGALAAPMDIIEERIIGPSLGKQNVERGLRAVLYSFAFALAFFLIYYRMFGVITSIALLLNMLMVVAVMSFLGATLTLPGLAGIALTVGMSVDANVLINERIREELRAGMPPQAAIATGYDKASGTIADANLTALLAGVALFAFGTGPVKGFAVSLIAGIITSMYTAVSVSRGIATLIYGRRRKLTSVAI